MEKINSVKIKEMADRITSSKAKMLISGIVCAIPFAFDELFLLSYISYIPLVLLFLKQQHRGKCVRTFWFGYAYYFVGYFWIGELYPLDFAGLTRLEGVFVVAAALIIIPTLHALMLAVSLKLVGVVFSKTCCFFKALSFPLALILCEFMQSCGTLAFPWCRVIVSQTSFLAALQSASVFGSYFITFIVALVNIFVTYAIINENVRKKCLAAAVCVFVLNGLFGVVRLCSVPKEYEKITAVALQGNISSSSKWSGSTRDMLDDYLLLAKKALLKAKNDNIDTENAVILMPETALPVIFDGNTYYQNRIIEFAKENRVNFAVGAFCDVDGETANALYMVTPDGKISAPYAKRHLVPFGEYVPYRAFLTGIFPFLSKINILSSDLYAGKETNVFLTQSVNAGALICYESIFPKLCRDTVKDGAQVLLISTNDSWFGESVALEHHLANAKMRAIEYNVPVIRAANTGISAIISPYGKVQTRIDANKTGFVYSEVRKTTGKTLYFYIGEWWILAYILALILFMLKEKRVDRG